MIIDTHAHLYLEQFDQDLDQVMARAQENGVQKILLPNIDSKTIQSMYALEQKYPDMVMAMMGLHPCHVQEDYQEELIIIKKELDRRSFIAVGEIGIDLYWDKQYVVQQKEAFITQCRWAAALDIPVVIHARESLEILLDILEHIGLEHLQGVFHCFGGDRVALDRVRELGFYIGLGGVITYKSSNMGKVLRSSDIDRIILETDAPYLAPVPFRGKRNESSYLPFIVQKLADILDLPAGEIEKRTTNNAKRLFLREEL